MLWSSLLAAAPLLAAVQATALPATTYEAATKKATTPTVTFSNAKRLLYDSDGNIIDAYGSPVNFFEGSYWIYGNSFSEIGTAYGINAYRSANLVDWKAQGNILTEASTVLCASLNGGCGRPHIVYNSQSKLYNLWANGGSYIVGSSSSPIGPFNLSTTEVYLDPQFSSLIAADFSVEALNGTNGYLVYSALNFEFADAGSIWAPIQQTLHISQLTDDFTNTTGVSYPIRSAANDLIDQETESPDFFKRGDWYYVGASNTCGYCNGSIALMYRSKSIKGPWTRQIIAADGCQSQFEGFLPLTNPTTGEVSYVWHGTSVLNAVRVGFGGHIFQPLTFNSDGSVADLNCAADATFTVPYTPGTTPVTIGAALTAGDATPATADYSITCDSDSFNLFQTWEASKTGTLKSVSIFVARGQQTVPLTLTVFNNFTSYSQLVAPGFVWNALGSASYNASQLTYVFDNATVFLDKPVAVTKGEFLGISISGEDFAPYCFNTYNTTGTSGNFHLFQRGTGQNSWRGLAGHRSPVYERIGQSIKMLATYA